MSTINRKRDIPRRLLHQLIATRGTGSNLPGRPYGVSTGGIGGLDEIQLGSFPLAMELQRTLRAWVLSQPPQKQWALFDEWELREAAEVVGMEYDR